MGKRKKMPPELSAAQKKLPRTLVLPFTISQNHDSFSISCFDHQENVSVKGLWSKQDTVLDLMDNLPKFLRWMKKSKHRSLSISVQADGTDRLYCEINHANKELHHESNSGLNFVVHARPLKDGNN